MEELGLFLCRFVFDVFDFGGVTESTYVATVNAPLKREQIVTLMPQTENGRRRKEKFKLMRSV